MELTQPLWFGLGLAVRINNQYSHPVCTEKCTDAYMTINDTWEISREYRLLTWEQFVGMGYRVDDGQMTWTDQSQMMTSCWSHTSQSHKSIAQMNRTK